MYVCFVYVCFVYPDYTEYPEYLSLKTIRILISMVIVVSLLLPFLSRVPTNVVTLSILTFCLALSLESVVPTVLFGLGLIAILESLRLLPRLVL